MNQVIGVVVAHPDDEVLGCGGTIAKHVAAGDTVHLLVLSDGETSRPSATDISMAHRNSALQQAAEILGIKSVHTAQFPDNQFDTVSLLSLTQTIERFFATVTPHTVYTHSSSDLNIDHERTARAVTTAARPQPTSSVRKILAFEVLSSTEWHYSGQRAFSPSVFSDISEHAQTKLDAIGAYQAEMRAAPHARSTENLKQQMGLRGHSVGVAAAEAFEAVLIID